MISWETKETKGDVRISLVNCDKAPQLAFTFYNGKEEKISCTNYMICGFDEENKRIYFKAQGEKKGYKLTSKGSGKTFRVGISKKKEKAIRSCKENYNLTHDSKLNLWFVGLEEKNDRMGN